MSNHETNFKIPKNIERYLATLSKLYANEGQKQLQEIIVNSQIRVHEAWSSDNWNGGTFGHAVYLVVPEFLYLDLVKQRNKLQKQIKADINNIHNVQNEFVEDVFLELELVAAQDWRKESGRLLSDKRVILPEAVNRIWGNEGYKIFLSHKNEVKKEAASLKEELKIYGISCFVAHEDIHPTKEWQNEIENALFSMDSLIALLTDKFHDSIWTDQEVGFAFGRSIPIIPVKLGKDPYGLIGKFQALSCSWDMVAKEIVKILLKHERMVSAYIKAVQHCDNYDNGNALAEMLKFIDKLSLQQTNDLLTAFSGNMQVHDSFGFNGNNPRYYGKGLVYHLNRLSNKTYRFSQSGEIEIVL